MTRENGFISAGQTRNWIRMFAAVYGTSACGYNIHAMSHLCHLRSLGELTETSAVGLECHYGDMKRRFMSGTPSTGLQAMQDCCMRNLGGHTCARSICVRPATHSKRCDDSLIFVRQHGLVRVTNVKETGEFEGEKVCCEPTNHPLPELDFTQVYAYRIARSSTRTQARTITFAEDAVVGKGCRVNDYVSMIPVNVLRER